uniref:Uncharacterized protein n=1 Tax=Anopheles braziliensis TaxID=58242 RepID=A0A2M3ZLK1_9DIPT
MYLYAFFFFSYVFSKCRTFVAIDLYLIPIYIPPYWYGVIFGCGATYAPAYWGAYCGIPMPGPAVSISCGSGMMIDLCSVLSPSFCRSASDASSLSTFEVYSLVTWIM